MLSPVEEIKSRLDIVEVIHGYLKITKAGSNWKGLCPFHSEKTPSFMVTPARQMWHCFGCGEGGDVFSFVQKVEGLEFADVLRMLAEKAGVKLQKQDPQVQSQRKGTYEICELASRFFERQISSKAGQLASEYLKSRGVSSESIENFRIGWAPDSWQSLRDFLRSENYSDKEIESAGLVVRRESTQTDADLTQTDAEKTFREFSVSSASSASSYHDRFRHRIMFPICDSQGQVVGFSGRIFDKVKGKTVHPEAGKYINIPNTLLYNKSFALFGIDKAKSAIRESGNCILVEGNLDVVMSHQAGVRNAVATCGTAFSQDHSKILKRYTDRLLFAFDADSAGDNALKKSIGIAMASGLSVSAVSIPFGKDTADAVKENPDLWKESASKPIPYIGYLISRSMENFLGTLDSKKSVLANVLPFIKIISSPLDRDFWLEEISRKIDVQKDVLNSEMRRAVPADSSQPASQPVFLAGKTEDASRFPGLRQEEYLLSLLIRYPELRKRIGDEELELFSHPRFLSVAKNVLTDGENIASFADSKVVVFSERLADFEIDPEKEFCDIIQNLKKQSFHSKLKTIQADIKKAEGEGDSASLDVLLKEFSELSKKLAEI